jgi:hypothetical protein
MKFKVGPIASILFLLACDHCHFLSSTPSNVVLAVDQNNLLNGKDSGDRTGRVDKPAVVKRKLIRKKTAFKGINARDQSLKLAPQKENTSPPANDATEHKKTSWYEKLLKKNRKGLYTRV